MGSIEHLPEHQEYSPEVERIPVAQFSMDLARHSIKGATPDGNDRKTPLSTAGMDAAVTAGTERAFAASAESNQMGVKVYGSPRERTAQSSVLRAFAKKFEGAHFKGTPGTIQNEPLNPKELVDAFKDAGLDYSETSLLDFNLGDGEYNAEAVKDFKEGKLFKYLVERSDEAVQKYKQDPKTVTSLSIQAGNVAEFLTNRATELRGASPADTVKQLTEFATSHQSVLESFLYKVIKYHDGNEAAQKFVAEDLNNAGFKENMGFHVEGRVYDKNDDENSWDLKLTYNGRTYVLKPEELQGIMAERDILRAQLEELRGTAK